MEGIKPGWVRVNFNYFISEAVFEFIVKAIHLIADHGWKLLPHYQMCPHTGHWEHRDSHLIEPMRLGELNYEMGYLDYRSRQATAPESALSCYLDRAVRIIDEAVESFRAGYAISDPVLPEDFEALRWFTLPGEALTELQQIAPGPSLVQDRCQSGDGRYSSKPERASGNSGSKAPPSTTIV